MDNGEEHSQDWQADTPENRSERQTLSLRRVPQEKPKTCQDSCPMVLRELLEIGIDG